MEGDWRENISLFTIITNMINKIDSKVIYIGILFGFSIVLFSGSIFMLGVIVITGITLWSYLPKEDRKFLILLFIWGIGIRIILFLLCYIVLVLNKNYGELIPDSRLYSLKALAFVRSWLEVHQTPEQVEAGVGNNLYVYILSLFYLITGYNPSLPNPLSIYSDKLINCLIGTIVGIPIFYLCKDIFSRKVAKISSLLVVFYPSLILWSMTNLRESINILLIALTIFLLFRFQMERKLRYFVLILILLLLVNFVRVHVFKILLVVSGILFFLVICKSVNRRVPKLVLLLIVLPAFFSFLVINKSIFQDKARNLYNNFAYSIKTGNTGIISQGGSIYRIYDDDFLSTEGLNIPKFLVGFLKGWFYFLLVPFPWKMTSLMQFITFPQMFIWYSLLPLAFTGILFSIRYRFKMAFILLMYLFVATSAFAIVEGNVGSALRHRDLVLPFYLIFSAIGILFVLGKGDIIEEKK